MELLLLHGADPTLIDRGGHSPESSVKNYHDPVVRALIRKAAISVRWEADLVNPKMKEKVRLAREKAREAGRLARERQKQAMKEREEAQRVKEQEPEAERAREQKLQNLRQGWARLREICERRGSQEVKDTKTKASASVTCAGSSSVWMERKGKGKGNVASARRVVSSTHFNARIVGPYYVGYAR